MPASKKAYLYQNERRLKSLDKNKVKPLKTIATLSIFGKNDQSNYNKGKEVTLSSITSINYSKIVAIFKRATGALSRLSLTKLNFLSSLWVLFLWELNPKYWIAISNWVRPCADCFYLYENKFWLQLQIMAIALFNKKSNENSLGIHTLFNSAERVQIKFWWWWPIFWTTILNNLICS